MEGSVELRDAVVLVVDDTEANVVLLDRLLRRAGVADVVGITDPRRAVDRYVEVQPDLILLDLHMPHLDGVEVLDALGAVIPEDSFVPILMLTADMTLAAKERALAAGAHDFVIKPFEHTEVLLRVRNLLRTRVLHRDLQSHNQALARELAEAAEREACIARGHEARVRRIKAVLEDASLEMVFQPIVDLQSSRVMGMEALARFPMAPVRPPNEWFDEAGAVGLGAALELLAVEGAVARLDDLPEGAYLSVNVSPDTALRSELADLLAPVAERVVVEVTEHAQVDQYDELTRALDRLRALGARLAVDDAGAGYAGLRHILLLRPDVIKLDIALTRGIDSDPARRALATALVSFADHIGAAIVAEGIETAAELEALAGLGVALGQGYYLARPAPLPVRAASSA